MTPHAQPQSRPEEQYIQQVIEHIPSAAALRSQIAMDLRSHIAERLEHGQSFDDVVRQLGDPAALAESYLGAVPLVSATFWERAKAKAIDVLAVLGVTVPLALVAAFLLDPELRLFVIAPFVFLSSVGFLAYTVIAEYRFGQTLGKRLLRLRVVRESGTRISLGQAIVRQLPALLQIFWIDVLFALFTDKSQRAFELISKTRVVRVPPEEAD